MQAKKSLYHPRFWGHWCLIALLWLVVHLPGRMMIGRLIGRLLIRALPYRGKVIARNLELAMPELDAAQREKLVREVAENIGVGLIETGMAWFWSDKALQRITRFSADPQALALVRSDEPVVLAGSHNTLLELGMRLAAFNIEAGGTYRPLRDPFFDQIVFHYRNRIAASELLQFRDMRNTLRLLREGKNIWYALDQDMGERVSVFAPFFGRMVACVDIIPQLHTRTGAHLVPFFFWREDDGHYRVHLFAPIAVAGRSSEAIMGDFNALLEAEIRKRPAQYFWVHRRFKTRPDGTREEYPHK